MISDHRMAEMKVPAIHKNSLHFLNVYYLPTPGSLKARSHLNIKITLSSRSYFTKVNPGNEEI